MQRLDQVPFVAAGGFTDDVNCGEQFEFLAQFAVSGGRVGEHGLTALAVDLERSLGDIDSDIDSRRISCHIAGRISCHVADRVLTHPYEYELLARPTLWQRFEF